MKPHQRTLRSNAQFLRDHKQLIRLTDKFRRTFESLERIQVRITRLLRRSQ